MASKSLGVLTIDLLMKTGQFEQGAGKAERAAQDLARNVDRQAQKVQHGFETAFTAIGIAAGVAFAGASIAVKKAIEDMHNLAVSAKQVAMPVEQFTSYAAAADNAEVKTQDFMTAMRTLLRNLQNAQLGSTRMQQMFASLDIDPKNIKTGEQALLAMADAFGKYRDDAGKAAIATQLMGRSGAALIPFLDQGSKSIKEQAKHMRDLGVAFGQDGADKLEDLDDAMDEWDNTLKGLVNTLTLQFVPILSEGISKVTEFLQAWNKNGGLDAFTDGVKTLYNNLDDLAIFFATRFAVAKIIGGFVAIGNAAKVAGTIVGTLRVLIGGIGGVIGLLATGIAALVVAGRRWEDSQITGSNATDALRKSIDQLRHSTGEETKEAIQNTIAKRQNAEAALKAAQANLVELQSRAQLAQEQARRTLDLNNPGSAYAQQAGLAVASRNTAVDATNRIKKQAEAIADLKKTIDDAQKAIDEIQKGGAKTDTGEDKPTLDINTQTKSVDKLSSAYARLYEAVQKVSESADPADKAYAAFADTVRNISKLGGDAIKAGGDVVRVQNAVAEAVSAARVKLDDDLAAPMKAAQEYAETLNKQLEDRKRTIAAQVASIGMGTQEAANQQELARAYQEATDALAEFQRQHELHPEAMTDDQYKAELEALKKHNEDMVNATKDGQKQIADAQGDWRNGVNKAIDDFLEQQRNVAAQAEQTTTTIIDGFGDAFASIVSGSESAKDAIGSLLDDLYKQALKFVANKAIQALLDAFKTDGGSGQGSGSGWAGLINNLASAFGGGKASGGAVGSGMFYQVNERGPELLTVGSRDYLMMGNQSGHITPHSPATRGRSGGTIINVAVQPTSTRRTAEQVAVAIDQRQRIATARNG